MKFLNEIDGASKLKQDSSNRLVTDVQKASWNSKAEGNHSHSKNEITDFPTSLPASGGQSTTTEHLVGDDTRSVNSPPSVYMSSGSRWAGRAGWQTEFKSRSTIGSPSSLSGTYVYLQTHTPWSDPSGGYPVQIAYGNGAPSWRVGISDSAWSDWESFNDNGNAATVNGKTVLTDVPINAKFTDTTYTEITTAEIDTGTASTLRTITGRRVKYILDKVQGWIGGLTKSDVGLSNVDNVKQATKVEFDSHGTNTTMHITNTERTNWNTKETTTGSQDKANQAEQNAKSYVDGKVLTDVPINAKFTDTVYSHPSSHPASMITESSTKRFVSDSEKSTWNSKSDTDTVTTINGKTGAISKADITALGVPSRDTVYKKPLSEPISYIQGLQAELDSKIESYGTKPVLNIAVINAGGSTTSIPNNTLILELE